MAKTAAADVASQTPEVWGTELYAQAENQTFWHMFEGPEGSGMPIIRKDDLEKGEGDTIHMDIVLALSGSGQTGDTTSVEGNEEKLVYRQTDLTVEALSHGVRWTKKGKILINHNMRTNARAQLAKWLAGKQDDAVWNELTGNGATTMPTNNKWFAGSATSRNTVADGDATGRVTLTDITEMKAYAQTELKMEPLRMENGEEFFGLGLHPYATMALKKSTAWQQAQREAQARGADNPLFTGSAAIWDGVVIFTNNRVPRSLNSGPIQVADNVFFGGQALSRGYAYYPDWTEEYFDYGREQGIATYTIKGDKLNVFDLTGAGGAAAANLTAIGSMVYYSAAVAPSA